MRLCLCSMALAQLALGTTLASAAESRDEDTATPIKHVIVIIGENRSFDHVFATYVPKSGDSRRQSALQGHHRARCDKRAFPGPHFDLAHQLAARDQGAQRHVLAQSAEGGISAQSAARARSWAARKPPTSRTSAQPGTVPRPMPASLALAEAIRVGPGANYYVDLLTGGTGQASQHAGRAHHRRDQLPAGPFQLTNGRAFTYDAYAASPVHRFYQMWQQLNCSPAALVGGQSVRLQRPALLVGRGHRRCGHQRRGPAAELQHRVCAGRRHDRRRLDRTRFLQRAAGRCPVLQEPRRPSMR